ncbi:MAG: hypothetical protein PVF25_07760, partial [Desulfobacterales bacterium]
DGVHRPNIRSPEGWQKDNARSHGVMAQIKRPGFPEGLAKRLPVFRGAMCASPSKALTWFSYYFNLKIHARLMCLNHQIRSICIRDGFCRVCYLGSMSTVAYRRRICKIAIIST